LPIKSLFSFSAERERLGAFLLARDMMMRKLAFINKQNEVCRIVDLRLLELDWKEELDRKIGEALTECVKAIRPWHGKKKRLQIIKSNVPIRELIKVSLMALLRDSIHAI